MTMIIGAQDPLDPSTALAAAQAMKQLLAPSAVSAQAAAPTPAQGLIADALTLSNLAMDPFASLLQQATAAPEPVLTPAPPAATESSAVQVASQLQDLTTVGTASAITQGTALEPPDPQSALLQQATLAPLAAQLTGGLAQGTTEAVDQAQGDVSATSALSPAGAFGNNQTSTPNPYTLVQTQPATATAYSGAGSAESYALMQQLLVPSIATGSLDLLV